MHQEAKVYDLEKKKKKDEEVKICSLILDAAS